MITLKNHLKHVTELPTLIRALGVVTKESEGVT